jgi:hypothetical protein
MAVRPGRYARPPDSSAGDRVTTRSIASRQAKPGGSGQTSYNACSDSPPHEVASAGEVQGGDSLPVGQDVDLDDEPVCDGESEYRRHAAIDCSYNAWAAIDGGEARLDGCGPVSRRLPGDGGRAADLVASS